MTGTHVLATPMEEVRRAPDGVRWCFKCRTRRAFDFVVSSPIVRSLDDAGAYYGPSSRVECTVCRTADSDLFPGREREWSDE